jgi:hypothetical protein
MIVPEVTLAPCDAKDAGDRRQCEYDGEHARVPGKSGLFWCLVFPVCPAVRSEAFSGG